MSVLFTVLKMDSGPILRQVTRPLQGDEKVRFCMWVIGWLDLGLG